MKQIDNIRKKFLEQELGCELCPFNVEVEYLKPGAWSTEYYSAYYCLISGTPATQHFSTDIYALGNSTKPCSLEYAKNCPLYQRLITVNFRSLYENPKNVDED